MNITIEISYYPLTEDYDIPIKSFIQKLSNVDFSVEIGVMSTILSGEYNKVMPIISESIGELMELYPSVFNIKISNSCSLSNKEI